jgi:hypothetical protein
LNDGLLVATHMRYGREDRFSISKFKHSFAANKQIIVPYSPGFGTKKSPHSILYRSLARPLADPRQNGVAHLQM